MSWLGFERTGDEWYVRTDPTVCDLDTAVSASVSFKRGQTRTVNVELRWRNEHQYIYFQAPEALVARNVELEFWLNITKQDTSVQRLPAVGSISILLAE